MNVASWLKGVDDGGLIGAFKLLWRRERRKRNHQMERRPNRETGTATVLDAGGREGRREGREGSNDDMKLRRSSFLSSTFLVSFAPALGVHAKLNSC